MRCYIYGQNLGHFPFSLFFEEYYRETFLVMRHCKGLAFSLSFCYCMCFWFWMHHIYGLICLWRKHRANVPPYVFRQSPNSLNVILSALNLTHYTHTNRHTCLHSVIFVSWPVHHRHTSFCKYRVAEWMKTSLNVAHLVLLFSPSVLQFLLSSALTAVPLISQARLYKWCVVICSVSVCSSPPCAPRAFPWECGLLFRIPGIASGVLLVHLMWAKQRGNKEYRNLHIIAEWKTSCSFAQAHEVLSLVQTQADMCCKHGHAACSVLGEGQWSRHFWVAAC